MRTQVVAVVDRQVNDGGEGGGGEADAVSGGVRASADLGTIQVHFSDLISSSHSRHDTDLHILLLYWASKSSIGCRACMKPLGCGRG